MQVVTINNWSFVHDEWRGFRRDPDLDEFVAPAPAPHLPPIRIHGKVTGHPRIEDGHRACTSPVVTIENSAVKTLTGTEYKLGDINPQYEEWLVENGWAVAGHGWF